ncbi:MAG: Homing endonuclease LAGLIDADG/HNH [Parcubacteria group bacterium Gr01-1014_29]|nr:MAG: Homing endonuclease LAGLIDADG/HNH [Parcubacteria group bacterium Gr01-1014_29]
MGDHEDPSTFMLKGDNATNCPKVSCLRCLSKIWLYAGTSVDKILKYPVLLWYYASIDNMWSMPSKNASGADNQQERLKTAYWISGFTDGEGCFSIALIRNSTTRFGKQVFPEFVVTQGAKSLPALRKVKDFFGCGNIFINKRYDNHNEHLYRYCVRSISELNMKIIPFFDQFQLYTYKHKDFKIFKTVIHMMVEKKHLQENGWTKICKLISSMNRKKVRF